MLSRQGKQRPRLTAGLVLHFHITGFLVILLITLLIHDSFNIVNEQFEPRHEKTDVLVSDPIRHKPGCTIKEDG